GSRHPAGAAARGARRLALPAGAAARGAGLEFLELDGAPGPRVCLLEADLDLGLEISASAPAARGPEGSPPVLELYALERTPARAEIPEDRAEELREVAKISGLVDVDAVAARASAVRLAAEPAGSGLRIARPVWPEGVVALALRRVGEDLVGLVDLLEPVGGGLDARVLVGMVLARELPVSLLDRLGVGGLRDAEDLVVVLVGNGHEGILAGAAPAAQARAGTGSPARRRWSSSPSSVSRTFSTSAARSR